MRNLLLIGLLFFMLTACQTDQKKAAKAAEHYIIENLKDPESYKKIELDAQKYPIQNNNNESWAVLIKYRAKNSFGAYVESQNTVYLDDKFEFKRIENY